MLYNGGLSKVVKESLEQILGFGKKVMSGVALLTMLYSCGEKNKVVTKIKHECPAGYIWDVAQEECVPEAPPSLSQIVSVSNRDGNNEIYSINPDGTNVQRLTDDPADDSEPVVYKNELFYTKDGVIQKMDLDTMLNTGLGIVGSGHDISPDGNELVYKAPTKEIEVASTVDGGFLRQLVDATYNGSDPDWSPDGSKVAFSIHPDDGTSWSPNDGIYTVNSDGGNLSQLTSLLNAYYELQPDWSPDGSKIAFRYFGIILKDSYIVVMDSDGTNKLFFDTTGYTSGKSSYKPAWSPDGERIVFNAMPEINTQPGEVYSGSSEIYSIRSDGTDITRLTNNSFWDGMPFWYK